MPLSGVDLIELNEAFAAQVLAVDRELKLKEKVQTQTETIADQKAQLAELYMETGGNFMIGARDRIAGTGHPQEKVMESAAYLAEHLAEVPAIVIPTIIGRHDGSGRPGLEERRCRDLQVDTGDPLHEECPVADVHPARQTAHRLPGRGVGAALLVAAAAILRACPPSRHGSGRHRGRRQRLNGFGIGSALFKPGMSVDEVATRAAKMVEAYDTATKGPLV